MQNGRGAARMKGKLKSIAEKLKTVRHIELILLAAAICIAVLVYLGVSSKDDTEIPVYTPQSQGQSEEARVEGLLESITGVGGCTVMVTYGEDGGVEGVVVSAEGAGDMNVKLKIIDVIRTLMNVDGGKIKVYKKQ